MHCALKRCCNSRRRCTKPLSQWDAGFNVHEAYHHQGLSQYDNLVLLPAETRNPQAPPHPIRH
ncbi:hypothetical protein C6P72_02710 [Burkholderia gladioli]|nr:hypothetical protein C6P72_02710 [Burkholderia gladioli]